MPIYVAMLRGVNVGRNSLKMERLREVCDELGFKNARTYVQSGNVVFQAKVAPQSWLGKFELALAAETRLPVSVIVRTPVEMGNLIDRNPFLQRKEIETVKLHVTFLANAPKPADRDLLAGVAAGADEYLLSAKEVFVYCPNGYGRTKLSNNVFEKAFGVRATTRNWNAVRTLYAMAAE